MALQLPQNLKLIDAMIELLAPSSDVGLEDGQRVTPFVDHFVSALSAASVPAGGRYWCGGTRSKLALGARAQASSTRRRPLSSVADLLQLITSRGACCKLDCIALVRLLHRRGDMSCVVNPGMPVNTLAGTKASLAQQCHDSQMPELA